MQRFVVLGTEPTMGFRGVMIASSIDGASAWLYPGDGRIPEKAMFRSRLAAEFAVRRLGDCTAANDITISEVPVDCYIEVV
jgi:hypothetical protein